MRLTVPLACAALFVFLCSSGGCESSVPDDPGAVAGQGAGGSASIGVGGDEASGGAGGDTGVGGSGAGPGQGGGGNGAQPIDAPLETWTWVDFDNAFCANGDTTGIGVNLTDQGDEVLIFMQGGGACWNNLTCYTLGTAAHITSGYDGEAFNNDLGTIENSPLFDREDDSNPFKNSSFVFVPYCTGDVHAGSATQDENGTQTMHVGLDNTAAYLTRLVATFPDASRVMLSGSSAGGLGATLNFWQVQQAFGDAPVWLLNDSGPLLPPPYFSADLQSAWFTAWNLPAAFPPGCSDCEADWSNLYGYLASSHADQRFALLGYDHDGVIAAYYQLTGDEVAEGLATIVTEQFDANSNAHAFLATGTDHTMVGNPGAVAQGDVELLDWLSDMYANDDGWTTVQP